MEERSSARVFIAFFVTAAWLFLASSSLAAAPSPRSVLTGSFEILYGDARDPHQAPTMLYFLHTSGDDVVPLSLDERTLERAGGALALQDKQVRVSGRLSSDRRLTVETMQPVFAPSVASLGVTGSQPTVSVMCRFADVANVSPQTASWVDDMVSGSKPSLDDYYREVSYDNVNLAGSQAFGWYDLPQPFSYYVHPRPLNPSKTVWEFKRMFHDCTAAADADVDFLQYSGVNLLFNISLDGWSYGGKWVSSLDGATRLYRTTWLSDWSWQNLSSFSHEVGHGFGLPHSSGQYGQVYDSQWDVMSDTWRCSPPDPVRGCVGPHTISFHKDLLGWIQSDRKYVVAPDQTAHIVLQSLALPDSDDDLMIKVPIRGSWTRFYTVERRMFRGYDTNLPGEGVIIHQVNLLRSIPAQVVDPDNNGNPNDAGAIWTPGETFQDVANGITISIESQVGSTMVVDVAYNTDLEVQQFASWDSTLVGLNQTYTIQITNHGPNKATNLSLSDTLPASAKFVFGSLGFGHPCTVDVPEIVQCSLPGLDVGATATARITVTLTETGTATNQVSVGSDEVDNIAPEDNSSAITTVVLPWRSNLAQQTVNGR